MKMGQSGRPKGGNLGGAGADRQIDSARKLAMGAPSLSELIDWTGAQNQSDIEYIVSEKFQLSWNHPLGAKILGQQYIGRLPDLRGYLLITYTLDRTKFKNELEGFLKGGDKIRKVFHALSVGEEWEGKVYQIKAPYCRKLELHESGWPHWHCILKTRAFIPENLIRKLWGFGIVDVERIKSDEFNYLLKYLVKDPTVDLPEWYKALNKVRVFFPTKGFFEDVTSKEKKPKTKKPGLRKKRQSFTIGERIENWKHQATIRKTVDDRTEVRAIKIDVPYRELAIGNVLEYAKEGKYLGDLKFKMNSNEELLRWMEKKQSLN